MRDLTWKEICDMLPERPADSQKGDFGRLLCITGSRNMPGACLLSTQGALRCGAGLVTVLTAPENPMRLAAAAPEAMWLSGQTDPDGFLLDQENHSLLAPHLRRADGILLGCGLGTAPETRQLVRWVLETADCPVILDADGLNSIADCIDIISRQRGKNWILTPHPGEMARLTGGTVSAVQENRQETARQFTEAVPAVLVLKGAGTLVAQRERLVRNPTGNPGMSRGGSGDVLAGMIAAFAVQGLSLWDAACAGVYLHGLAGDAAAAHCSQQAMLPRDLLAYLPEVLLRLEQER